MLHNHFKNFDWWLFGSAVFLAIFGIIMLAGEELASQDIFFKKQLFFGILGAVLVIFISFFDYRRLKTHYSSPFFIYILSLVALAAVLFFGVQIRGSVSWLRIGFFSVEPVEFVKIALLIFLAKFFTLRHAEIFHPAHIILSAVYVAIPTILVLRQPDLGSAIILIMIWTGIILVAGIKKKHFAILSAIFLVLISVAWFGVFKDYQKARIISFLNPLHDPLGAGYNILQARIAIGSGGIWGAGLGQGNQTRFGFLPEARTDFVFAAIAEEFGFVGVLLIFSAYGLLFFRVLKIVSNAPNNFARLFCFGFLILLFSQFAINVGMNLGLVPVTGITLPFVSYGGSSLISLFIALGLVESIAVRNFKVVGREV